MGRCHSAACVYGLRLKLELLLFLAPRGLHVLQLAYPIPLGEQPHNWCYLSLYPDGCSIVTKFVQELLWFQACWVANLIHPTSLTV